MKIAVLGYGTVGSGVVEVLKTNAAIVEKRAGEPVEVKYVFDLREFPGDSVSKVLVHDYNTIKEDGEIELIVEVLGGLDPSYSFVKEALQAGKSVCSSNKELVAKHGAELIAIAKEQNCNFFFEASVGGGIPLIRPMNHCLTADDILQITGILNGTTNYILSRMTKEDLNYEEVLKDAQELGYAERNPSADVDGHDAARKIAILMSLAYGAQVDYEDLYVEGITKISKEDIAYAKSLQASIKLLGICKKEKGHLFALVAPYLIFDENPLYPINDVYNGILVQGNLLGDVMFYGSGAGKLPTASAVVSDVIEAAKVKGRHISIPWDSNKLLVSDKSQLESSFFVRVLQEEMDQAKQRFAIKQEVTAFGITGEYAFLTERMREEEFEEKIKGLTWKGRIRL